MTISKTERAAGYLAAYIRTSGRFDLQDVADRAGVGKELEFLTQDILELLEDKDYLFDLEDMRLHQEAREAAKPPLVSDWLKELTSRYFG